MAAARRNLIALLLLVATLTSARSDNDLRFRVYAPLEVTGLHLGVYDNTKQLIGLEPVNFQAGSWSVPYDYAGPLPLVFHDSEGTPMAVANVPEACHEALLIFDHERDADAKFTYRIIVVDSSAASIPPGHLIICNATPFPLTAILRLRTETAEAGMRHTLPTGPGSALEITHDSVIEIFARSRNGGQLLAYRTEVQNLGPRRAVLALFPPRSRGGSTLRGTVLLE